MRSSKYFQKMLSQNSSQNKFSKLVPQNVAPSKCKFQKFFLKNYSPSLTNFSDSITVFFFCTQQALVLHLLRYFCNVHDHIVAFKRFP